MKNYLLGKEHPDVTKLFLRKMKITCLMLLMSVSSIFASYVNSQVAKVNITAKNTSINSVLKEIEQQTDYLFVYNKKEVDLDRKIDVTAQNKTVAELLSGIFEYTNVIYAKEGDNIMLIYKDLSNQELTIKGKVKDVSGSPLPGVNVVEKGTTNGAITNLDGEYTISINSPDAILSFSYVGFLTEDIEVAGRTMIDLTMIEDIQSLEEVVVIGYGTQKKETVTGAISEIDNDDIVKNSVADVTNSIAGRLPGVIAVQRSGEPGDDAAQLFIRGQSTLNDNSPLVMVDGVERPFNRIDPNNIESISVLKDASATAVYGVRGANGVILITTKRGKESKPIISYSGYYGVQNPIRVPDYLNSYDYARLYNEAQLNDNPSLTPDQLTYSADDIQKYKDRSDPYDHPDVDWNEERIRTNAPQQRHSLSMTGGTETIKYYTSFGVLDQDGILPNFNFKSYNYRANIDAEVTKSTNLSINLSGAKENRNRLPGGAGQGITVFNSTAPNAYPVRWENGTWASQWGINPVADLTESGYRNWNNATIQTSFILNQKLNFITDGLAFKILGAYDANFIKEKVWSTPYKSYQKSASGYSEVGAGKKPSLSESFSQGRSTAFELHLSYDKKIGNHKITGLLLYTQSGWYKDSFYAERSEYNSAAIDQLFAGPELNPANDGWALEGGREGYVGRTTYAYNSKYLFEANFGYNGSENFPPNKRFGFFPSAAIGWIISEESFFQSIKFVDFLKIRTSYGEVGNDKIGGRRFLYKQPFYYGRGYVLGGNSPIPVQSIYSGGLPNPNVTWEKAKKTNIGIDSRFLNNMFALKADLFYERRDNILATRNESVPETFGAELPVENIAKVDNKGIELELFHTRQQGSFKYSVGGNFTFARNEIKYIDEPENVPAWQKRTGRPMGQYYGYVAKGLYMTEEQLENNPKFDWIDPQLGNIMYTDIDGDGKITEEDKTAIGYSRIPEIMFGINLNAEYKGFDFSALIQGAGRSNVYFSQEAAWEFLYSANSLELIKGRWTTDGSNPNPTYPRLSLYRNEYKKEESSYWLRDASYWRLKNIELGYTLPENLLTKLDIENLRIYVGGTNIFTHSKFEHWDPEAPDGTGTYYPQLKVTTIGINVTF